MTAMGYKIPSRYKRDRIDMKGATVVQEKKRNSDLPLNMVSGPERADG